MNRREPLAPIDDWAFIWKASLYEHAANLRHKSGFSGMRALELAEMRLRIGVLLDPDKEVLPVGFAIPRECE